MNNAGAVTTALVQPDATLYHAYANRATLGPGGANTSGATQVSQATDAALLGLMADQAKATDRMVAGIGSTTACSQKAVGSSSVAPSPQASAAFASAVVASSL